MIIYSIYILNHFNKKNKMYEINFMGFYQNPILERTLTEEFYLFLFLNLMIMKNSFDHSF